MSENFPPVSYLNEPQDRHRRQTFWQIYLPLTIGFAAFLLLGILVVLSQESGNQDLTRWAAIAIIWLILPALAIGIAALLVNLLFIILFAKINTALPDYGRLARFHFYGICARIRNLADRLVQPSITLQSNVSGMKTISTLFRNNNAQKDQSPGG